MSAAGPNGGKRHVWDDPANVKLLIRWFLASCVVVALVDLVVRRHSPFEHGELPLEGTWFFYCWYGFVACVLLVVIAKQMRRVVMRDEDYYESATGPPEESAAGDPVREEPPGA